MIPTQFNDYLQDRSIKKSQGRQFVPEARLWALPVPTVLMAVGLVLLGQALGHQWHYMAIAAFWGLFVFSAMTSTVVITAYVLDCFPEHSVVTAALLNFARVLFGFLVPLFQKKWIDAIGGAQWSFLCQAVICLVAYVLVAVVQKFGGRWRERTGLSPDVIAMKSEARKGVRQV